MPSAKNSSHKGKPEIVDGLHSHPDVLEENLGPAAKALVTALDRAIGIQTSLIHNYVHRLRKKYPEATPAQLQDRLDSHFLRLSTGSGAGVGATAAVPGIGFIAATAAVSAESVLFLDAASFYTMSSAYLRGANISDPERRRALILVCLLGSKGSAIVDTMIGDLGVDTISKKASGMSTTQILNSFGRSSMGAINNRLMRSALKRVTRRMMRGWIGKIMPLGIGAIAGTITNRRLAKDLISNVSVSLGPVPQEFAKELEQLPEIPKEQAKEIDSLDEIDALEDNVQKESSKPFWKFWKKD